MEESFLLLKVARSCLEHFKLGMTTSGFYRIQGNSGGEYKAYCDMTSESNSAWTLVLSYSFKNASQFRESLMNDFPVSVDNPNWSYYRLSKAQMDDLKKISTHWRITCSFRDYGVDFTDYLRAIFSAFDPRGDTPIHKLYGNVPPFRVWFFDRPLLNRVSNSKISEKFL